jgi:peptidoglycan hydrolase-like protein with peptidoglycan-binding domain
MNAWTLIVTVIALALALTATPPSAAADEKIEQMQKALKAKGHDPGRIDGVMGPQTTAALKAYQKEQRLEVTGQADDTTLAKLGEPSAAKPSASDPRKGATGQQQTGGDTKPSAVDPAQATKTGANVGEGASYSRSTEKGQSTMKGDAAKK